MLNWEIEIRRWCPAFKIITYYGSPKERKLKRQVSERGSYSNHFELSHLSHLNPSLESHLQSNRPFVQMC